MKKLLYFILCSVLILSFTGCKKPTIIDNKLYKVKLILPNENWSVSKLSIPQAQIIEKKASLGTVSIMTTKVDDKDVPGVSKKSLDDIFSILKSKTAQKKAGIDVKEIGAKTLNNLTWRGLQITFKMPGNLGTIIQTIFITKKGQSAFIVALHAPPQKDIEAKKDLESVLSKIEFEEVK